MRISKAQSETKLVSIENLLRKIFVQDPEAAAYRHKIYDNILGKPVEFGNIKDQKWFALMAEDVYNRVVTGAVLVSVRNGCTGYICFLGVDNAFRRGGVGKALVERAIRELHILQVETISLTCYSELIPFYINLGFERISSRGELYVMTYVPLKAFVSSSNNGDLVKDILSRILPGTQYVESWDSANFVWKPTLKGISGDFITSLDRSGGKINHLSDGCKITRKDTLFSNFSQIPHFDVLPQTFFWKPDMFQGCSSDLWIIKPVSSFGGSGIKIVRGFDKVNEFMSLQPNPRNWLIQKYIESPLLTDEGRKFDVRVFVMVLGRRVYVCNKGYARISHSVYSPTDLEKLDVHLTNTCFQTQFTNQVSELHKDMYELVKEGEILPFIEKIASQFPKIFDLGSHPSCFEIFGLDVIFDRDRRPWLLEINTNCSLSTDTPVSKQFIPSMLEEALTMVFGQKRKTNNWFQITY